VEAIGLVLVFCDYLGFMGKKWGSREVNGLLKENEEWIVGIRQGALGGFIENSKKDIVLLFFSLYF
jgi:hypothetical protein